MKEIQEFEDQVRKEKEEEARRAEEKSRQMQSFIDRLVYVDKKFPLFEPEFLATVPERHARILVSDDRKSPNIQLYSLLKIYN